MHSNQFISEIMKGNETPSFTEWWDESGPTERRGGNIPTLPKHRFGMFRVNGKVYSLACDKESGMLGGRVTWSAYPSGEGIEKMLGDKLILIPEY